MTSYIELDSTFRNRTLWPLAGEFNVHLSQTGVSLSPGVDNVLTSGSVVEDPINSSDPVVAWTGSFFNETSLGNNKIRGIIKNTGLGFANSSNLIEMEVSLPDAFQAQYNYYNNAVLRNVSKPGSFSRVFEYIYIGNGRARIKFENLFLYDFGDTVELVDPTDLSDPTNGFLFVPSGGANSNVYNNTLIYNETLAEDRPISSYDPESGVLLIGGDPVLAWLPTHNYSIRKIIPNYTTLSGPNSSLSQIEITGTPATNITPDAYKNWFVRILPQTYNNTINPPQGETRRVVSYDAVTKVAKVFPPFTGDPTGLVFELSQFGYDNSVGLSWGAYASVDVPMYYVSLKKLVLPNKSMFIGNGAKPVYQSHFYVELSDIEASQSTTYLLNSNNPYTGRVVFRTTVSQIPEPETYPFITLEGDGMQQLMRFKLNSNLYFKVTLASTGQVFDTSTKDTSPPSAPNPELQINALFEFIPFRNKNTPLFPTINEN